MPRLISLKFMLILLFLLVSTNLFAAEKRQVCISNKTANHLDVKDQNKSWVFDLLPLGEECFLVDSGSPYNKKFFVYRHDTEDQIQASFEFNLPAGSDNALWEIN